LHRRSLFRVNLAETRARGHDLRHIGLVAGVEILTLSELGGPQAQNFASCLVRICNAAACHARRRGTFDRQMVDILTAVLTDGLQAVEAACAEPIDSTPWRV
jgi:hypothetical protein